MPCLANRSWQAFVNCSPTSTACLLTTSICFKFRTNVSSASVTCRVHAECWKSTCKSLLEPVHLRADTTACDTLSQSLSLSLYIYIYTYQYLSLYISSSISLSLSVRISLSSSLSISLDLCLYTSQYLDISRYLSISLYLSRYRVLYRCLSLSLASTFKSGHDRLRYVSHYYAERVAIHDLRL